MDKVLGIPSSYPGLGSELTYDAKASSLPDLNKALKLHVSLVLIKYRGLNYFGLSIEMSGTYASIAFDRDVEVSCLPGF